MVTGPGAVLTDLAARAAWFTATADAIEAAGPEHFTVTNWYTDNTGDAPRRLALVAEDRRHLDPTDDGAAADLGGWLVFTAPEDLVRWLIAEDVDMIYRRQNYAPGLLAETFGYRRTLWASTEWADLRAEDPAVYGVLDATDAHASAVAFLRQEAARLTAGVTG